MGKMYKEGDFLADKLNGIWEEQDMTPSDRDRQDGDKGDCQVGDLFTVGHTVGHKRMSENSDEFSDHLEEPLVIGVDFIDDAPFSSADDMITAVQKFALTREAFRKQQCLQLSWTRRRLTLPAY